MRGKIMLVGPEETRQRMIIFRYLMGLAEATNHLPVDIVHRGLGAIKRSIDKVVDDPKLPMIFQTRLSVVNGKFSILDEVLKELAMYGIISTSMGSTGECVEFASDAQAGLADLATRLADLSSEESGGLDRLARIGVNFAKAELIKSHGCD